MSASSLPESGGWRRLRSPVPRRRVVVAMMRTVAGGRRHELGMVPARTRCRVVCPPQLGIIIKAGTHRGLPSTGPRRPALQFVSQSTCHSIDVRTPSERVREGRVSNSGRGVRRESATTGDGFVMSLAGAIAAGSKMWRPASRCSQCGLRLLLPPTNAGAPEPLFRLQTGARRT